MSVYYFLINLCIIVFEHLHVNTPLIYQFYLVDSVDVFMFHLYI